MKYSTLLLNQGEKIFEVIFKCVNNFEISHYRLRRFLYFFPFIVHVKEMVKVLLDYPLFFIWGQF